MEVPPPYTWSGSTTATTQHLHPFQPSPLPLSTNPGHPFQASLPPPAPPGPPPGIQREERAAPLPRSLSQDTSRGERTASDREHQQSPRQRAPLPDLLPRGERPLRASARPRAPGEEAEPRVEEELRRVGYQLRTIGDHLNATILQRAEGAPQWQDWRGACRGLLTFITDTLSTLYRLR